MYHHVLLPTDGSKLSEDAVRKGVRLARCMNARVTGVSVVPKLQFFAYDAETPATIMDAAARECRRSAEAHLAYVRRAAEEAGVACEVVTETDDQPHAAIIRTAEKRRCDLIMMASHGRRGISGILLGSETQKVLTHSKIPVLVFR
jgi:nucleotide-binding universal stress UspA family protein